MAGVLLPLLLLCLINTFYASFSCQNVTDKEQPQLIAMQA